ncbi:hypothetical protein B0T22DRAFT_457684 [Podospora appendiculata]|uniref:Oxidoreductase n=1 Tax=Podospora appendiculata TaxID=314037 RepID=A0AAE1CBN9_9PEZI|nr:hypothetical protein B0T22DRAFT_457684 [Podospora appendiculata]
MPYSINQILSISKLRTHFRLSTVHKPETPNSGAYRQTCRHKRAHTHTHTAMPLPFLAHVFFEGAPSWVPDPWLMLKVGSALGAVALTKRYFSGAVNLTDRNLHGRVVLITGGTSGIGAVTAYELARRGAQIVLLTHLPQTDPFLVDFIDDMRERSENDLIYAETVDLSSLHSIRLFATKWVDNAPPRRLDSIILCAATLTPPGSPRAETTEGIETTWMVNYLANFHLLAILSPAIRAQPFDRDVRIVIPTCSAYIASPPLDAVIKNSEWSASTAYARSKLALMVFAKAFQKHLDAYKRPDEMPMNARVVLVDPGFTRTPGSRRWLSRGSLWGIVVYLVLYVFAWIFMKSAEMGAQSLLFAVMDGGLLRIPGGQLIKECMRVDFARKDVTDEAVAKTLWESSDKLIEKTEKEQAEKRAKAKKEEGEREKKAKEEATAAERLEEIESLLNTIKKGKAKDAQKGKKPKPSSKAVK